MNKLSPIILFLGVIAIGAVAYFFATNRTQPVTNYDECAALPGSVIQESYPPVCVTKSGQRFMADVPPLPQPTQSPDLSVDLPNEGCKVSGCNNEICQNADEEPVSSVCVYEPRFDCYNTAICEKQEDGNCGWRQTEELTSCLESYE